MLDEECLLPHGTDNGFVALLECQTQVRIARGCERCTNIPVLIYVLLVHRNSAWYIYTLVPG